MQRRWIWLFVVFFPLLWLISGTNISSAQPQAYVTVKDTTLASGETYQQVAVLLTNDVPIQGIQLMFTSGYPSITDFTTDWIEVDTVSSPGDTFVIRHWKVETSGTLVENFEWLVAHGEVGDTAFLECDYLVVAGMAQDGQPIPPGAGVLFKLYVDLLCIPDTTQDRTAGILVNGYLSDADGSLVETQFKSGSIWMNQTICGTLLDCICGDVNADGAVDVVDVTYMINYLLKNGPALCPELMGDINLSRGVSISDIVYLINYVLKSGPEPQCLRKY